MGGPERLAARVGADCGIGGPWRNVELKARDHAPERSLAAGRALGAEDRGVLEQRDVYFAVPHGRLKLRWERMSPGSVGEAAHRGGEGARLIQYRRPDEPRARVSRYRLMEVAAPAELEAALAAAIGVLAEVEKRRRLLLWRGVRIHLDRVSALGDFVELEAVAAGESDLRAERALVAELAEALRIDRDRLVRSSYLDLVRAARGGG